MSARIPVAILGTKPLPSEKALPMPPSFQLSPLRESRALIDAAEIPLKRSPRDRPNSMEDWPALSPQKPSNSLALVGSNAPYADVKTSLAHEEGIPVTANSSNSFGEHLAHNMSVVMDTVSRPSSIPKLTHTKSRQSTCHTMTFNEFMLQMTEIHPETAEAELKSRIKHRGKATEVGNFANTSTDLTLSRQTRAPNVQALRCSFEPDDPHEKALDFMSASNDLHNMTDDMTTDWSGSGIRARSGLPTPVGRIAGSRRPVRKSQGETQGSMKAMSGAKQPHDKPTSNPGVTQHKGYTSKEAMADTKAQGQLESAMNSNAMELPTSTPQPVRAANGLRLVEGETSLLTFGRSQPIPRDEISTGVRSTSGKMSRTDLPPLSPYITRRLSTASPEFGPTLRVSSSAERVIMGDENHKHRTIRRVPVPAPKEAHKARRDHPRTTILNEDRTFPFSGQSFRTKHESRIARPSSEARKMRTASEDARSSVPKEHPNQDMRSVKAISAGSRGTTLSTGEDPFFDAQTHVEDTITVNSHPESSKLEPQALPQTAGFEGSNSMYPAVEQAENFQRASVIPVHHDLPATTSHEHTGNPAATNSLAIGAHDNLHKESEETASDFETASHSDQDLAITQSGSFPPRSSSRTPAKESTHKNSSSMLPALEPVISRDISTESVVPQNSPNKDAKSDRKRASFAQPSTKSRVLSGVRGLFHKGKKVTVAENGSPMPPVAEAHPAHRPTVASENRRAANIRAPMAAPVALRAPVMATPAPEATQVQSGLGNVEIDDVATLVRQVLHMAHTTPPGPEKDRLLATGRTMFGAFTLACDAEMAREAANQSIRRAEIAYAQCMQSIMEMAECVRNGAQG
ncbi:hypothetical protein MMC30_005921 [Trapelia coarctata]|nr:hypothetical protein [Trapelia coarctata]